MWYYQPLLLQVVFRQLLCVLFFPRTEIPGERQILRFWYLLTTVYHYLHACHYANPGTSHRYHNTKHLGDFTGKVLSQWTGSVVGTLFCGCLGLLFRFMVDWFKNLHLKREIENIKLQSELDAIKSKLNPHLLFNTLNNIDTLIQIDPEKHLSPYPNYPIYSDMLSMKPRTRIYLSGTK